MVRMNGLEMGNVMKTPIRRSCIPERDLPSAEFFFFVLPSCYVKSWASAPSKNWRASFLEYWFLEYWCTAKKETCTSFCCFRSTCSAKDKPPASNYIPSMPRRRSISRPSRRSQANDDLIFAADAQAAYIASMIFFSSRLVSRYLTHISDFYSFLAVSTIDRNCTKWQLMCWTTTISV